MKMNKVLIYKINLIRLMIKMILKQEIGTPVPWCSGYHVCFTRKRSPVRSRAEPMVLLPYFSIIIQLIKHFNQSIIDPPA